MADIMVAYKGVAKSAEEWGEKLSLSPDIILDRYFNREDRNICIPVNLDTPDRRLVPYNGDYYTLKELEQILNVKKSAILRALKLGIPLDDCTGPAPDSFIEIGGVKRTRAEWEATFGCSVESIKANYKKDYYMPQKDKKKGVHTKHLIQYEGKFYTYDELSDLLDMSYDAVKKMFKPSNLQKYKPRVDRQFAYLQKIEADDETHTVKEWSKKLGIPPHVILRRLDKGFVGKEAIYGKESKKSAIQD